MSPRLGPSLPLNRPQLYWLTRDVGFAGPRRIGDWRRLSSAGAGALLDLLREGGGARDAVEQAGLAYLNLPLDPTEGIGQAKLSLIAGWVDGRLEDHKRILVYCPEAPGLAATVACAGLIGQDMPLPEILQALLATRQDRWVTHSQLNELDSFVLRRRLSAQPGQEQRRDRRAG